MHYVVNTSHIGEGNKRQGLCFLEVRKRAVVITCYPIFFNENYYLITKLLLTDYFIDSNIWEISLLWTDYNQIYLINSI